MTKLEVIENELKNGLTPQEALERAKLKVKSGRKYTPADKSKLAAHYDRDEKLRRVALEARVPFISKDTGMMIYPGFVLVGGVSGQGKSTLMANLLAGYVQSSQKKAVVISNEESLGAIYNRVACILLGVNFNKFHHNQVSERTVDGIRKLALDLMDQIDVVDDDAWDMAVMEDVQAVLEHAAENELGLIGIDYYQTINQSRENPELEPYAILKRFGFWLKDYSRKVAVPVVALAQMRTGDDEFKDRVEGDRTVYNHCFQALEVLPDFEARNTKFKVIKDRFGFQQGQEITLEYVDGRFEFKGAL